MPRIKRKTRPPAFILVETLIGLAVASAAIAVAGSAMSQYRTGMRNMLAIQNLKANASACLLALRANQAPTPQEGVSFELLSQEPSPTTPGRVWAQIAATAAGPYSQRASLWGLVPQSSLTRLPQKAQ